MALRGSVPPQIGGVIAEQPVTRLERGGGVAQTSSTGYIDRSADAPSWGWSLPAVSGFVAAATIGHKAKKNGKRGVSRKSGGEQYTTTRLAELQIAQQGLVPQASTDPNFNEIDEIIARLATGNQAYVSRKLQSQEWANGYLSSTALRQNPIDPSFTKVVVLTCATPGRHGIVEDVFSSRAGELSVIRVFGHARETGDGVMGSVEFAITDEDPKVLLVLGTSDNPALEAAVRLALAESGRKVAKSSVGATHEEVKDLHLIQKLLPVARDAVSGTSPTAPFRKICDLAATLNMWATIEGLLKSQTIYDKVMAGKVSLQGALLDSSTGVVHFAGTHPSQAALLEKERPRLVVRTAEHPAMPAQEALCSLEAGNRRFVSGQGGRGNMFDREHLRMMAADGQNPMAVVFGCADSRAPVEIIFDQTPGDLFVLRTAGNTVKASIGSMLGSAEYACTALKTRLIVVTGHSACGAVSAAVKFAKEGPPDGVSQNISSVINSISKQANQAIEALPDAPMDQQVAKAIELNVFSTMKKIMKYSDIIRDGVASGDIMVVGAIYNIQTANVEWLGKHPRQQEICGSMMALEQWTNTPYQRGQAVPSSSKEAEKRLTKLMQGNLRFVTGNANNDAPANGRAKVLMPDTVILGPAKIRVPLEKIFDTRPGEVITQRCMGSIAGRPGGDLFSSMEFIVKHYQPKVLVVLVQKEDIVLRAALEQVAGTVRSTDAIHTLFNQLMPSCSKAVQQVRNGRPETSAGSSLQEESIATELSAFYTIQSLMIYSTVIREAAKNGLEVHAAVLDPSTGEVDFVGQHPMVQQLLSPEPLEAEAEEVDSDAGKSKRTRKAAPKKKATAKKATRKKAVA